jgi:hypothetical protein
MTPQSNPQDFFRRSDPAANTHKTDVLYLPDEQFLKHLESLNPKSLKNITKQNKATKRSKDAEEKMMNIINKHLLTERKGGKRYRKTKKRRRTKKCGRKN